MKIFLNTAGAGLLSPAAVAAAQKFQNQTLIDPSDAFLNWMAEDLPVLRKNTATLLDADENQISFLPNFSFALSAIIQSLLGRVKKVLLYKEDYPSLNLPFKLADFSVHYINSKDDYYIETEAIIRTIEKENIEVVAFSHVQFLSGFKMDIEAVGQYCQDHGVIFIVDGTQSIGATPVSFQKLPVDVLISSSYKWLNGGFGSAILCVKGSFMEHFPPRIAGYGSINQEGLTPQYEPSNKSFEPGHLNAPALLQLNEGIRHKLDMGLNKIEKHNSQLIQKLQEQMAGLHFPLIGGEDLNHRLHILIFRAEKSVAEYLKKEGFSLTWRQERIRISLHFYNTDADIEALISSLKNWEKK